MAQPWNILGGFLEGRDAAMQEQDRASQNALAQRDQQMQEQQFADSHQNALINQEQAQRETSTFDAQREAITMQHVLQSPTPKQAALQGLPNLVASWDQQHGPGSFEQLSDEQVHQIIQAGYAKVAGQAGMAPPEQFQGSVKQQELDYKAQLEANAPPQAMTAYQQAQLGIEKQRLGLERQKANTPAAGFRPLSKEEVAAAGLPPGSAAQVDNATGKIDVIGKRDTTGVLSQKDATVAKVKLNTVKMARKQLAVIKQNFAEGRKGMNAFGPGQGLLPTQQGKKFDAAVNQMRSTVTALTRTPGVGSMSDYETKLDQSKFPKRTDYEAVTEQQIQGLDDMLNAIESGYSGILTGQGPEAAAPAASGGWTVKKVR